MELMVGGGAAAGPTPREPWPGTTIRGLRRLPRASCVCRVAPAAVCGMYELCWFRFRPFEFLFLGFFFVRAVWCTGHSSKKSRTGDSEAALAPAPAAAHAHTEPRADLHTEGATAMCRPCGHAAILRVCLQPLVPSIQIEPLVLVVSCGCIVHTVSSTFYGSLQLQRRRTMVMNQRHLQLRTTLPAGSRKNDWSSGGRSA